MAKRLLAIIMAVALLFALGACNDEITESEILVEVSGDPTVNSDGNGGNGTTANEGSSGTDAVYVSGKSGSNSGTNNGGTNNGGTNNGGSTTAKGKTLDDDLDLGGKEVTKTIIGTISGEVQRRAAAFEKEYNCEFKFVKLKWDNYNSSVASSIQQVSLMISAVWHLTSIPKQS